ncbi:glycosylase, partial [Candidatus Nomurabacteria bacterium]|nr:glycosylase [Candidatus Nomurabacteria bacterium]
MGKIRITGEKSGAIPWEDRPAGSNDVMWRYSGNPIINRNPNKTADRVFNSGVLPYGEGYIGIFRGDKLNGKPQLFLGRSDDGLSWHIEDDEIRWVDENNKSYQPNYAYDPRLVRLGDTFYIIWCTDFSGAALGLGKTNDFKTFTRLENPFLPFNRNGVLFPRKINGNYLLLSRPSDNGHTPFGDIFVSESPDLVYWGKHRKVMSSGGSGWWQDTKIGGGPIPVETDKGWLLIYHGVITTCNGFVYSFGAAILDLNDPSKVLSRGAVP